MLAGLLAFLGLLEQRHDNVLTGPMNVKGNPLVVYLSNGCAGRAAADLHSRRDEIPPPIRILDHAFEMTLLDLNHTDQFQLSAVIPA